MTSNRGRLGGTSVAFRPMRRIQKCSLLATFKILSSNNLGHICGNNTSMISHRSVLDDSQKKSCSLLHYAVGFTPRVLTEVPTCKRERSEVQVIHSLIHSFVGSFVRSFFLQGVKHGLKAHQGETLICLTKYPLAPKTALYIRKNYTTNLSPGDTGSSFLFLDSHGMVRSFSFKTPPEAGAARAPLRVGVWVPLNAKDRTRG